MLITLHSGRFGKHEFTFDIAEYVDDKKEGKELIGGDTVYIRQVIKN